MYKPFNAPLHQGIDVTGLYKPQLVLQIYIASSPSAKPVKTSMKAFLTTFGSFRFSEEQQSQVRKRNPGSPSNASSAKVEANLAAMFTLES